MNKLLNQLQDKKARNEKALAVLIDPDKSTDIGGLIRLVNLCVENKVDYLLVGGSLITNDNFSKVISIIKSNSNIPVVIFPGNHIQIDSNADAIFLLSLISGRNADFLIGQHVLAAPILKKSKLEVIPMGYMLVNSGAPTSASYMSNTVPLPSDKPTIAACTAMAGEMLGLQTIYLDAGSGADEPIPQKVISTVARSIEVPLVVGGGLNSLSRVNLALEAGADMVVIGNALEKEESLLIQVSERIHVINEKLDVH
ncbi:geranylgeranylglyceryl/heptaprenylglyceryl phosphate synthase [Reichenbachiella carrageenanivorans]|uniref:Geranylgeranylglyceryl phosphate synthase n=1 Tax=Reichenbachiella carrageenanivorans TaxID=2979869 RepID=A0ABY6D3M8_9BACT|nr:geranylgeranylglyceryl/heptaprenylglyceryl phosphate synthase [Reichenbachiella carrageenanivorans]UXX80756.1 geranylgeranylglyceryl/heptaprenylglyceryl phosphate synthase [Reichenbachiella carrageenanivorans]